MAVVLITEAKIMSYLLANVTNSLTVGCAKKNPTIYREI